MTRMEVGSLDIADAQSAATTIGVTYWTAAEGGEQILPDADGVVRSTLGTLYVELPDEPAPFQARIIASADLEANHARIVAIQAEIKELSTELEERKAALRTQLQAGQTAFSQATGDPLVELQAQREFSLTEAVTLLTARIGSEPAVWQEFFTQPKPTLDAKKIRENLTAVELEQCMIVRPGTMPKVLIK